jgi:alpha-galactosidase
MFTGHFYLPRLTPVFSDCGWQGTARNSSGAFTWNTALFPSGIPSLVNYVHQKGLKFGLYGDAGYAIL